ncbi:MAG: hypothetical protein JXQ83_05890 [Candidatus Glassbacteria bacterium]|nr:hypothetical protein [Candidatus Glassbacteria bacterium]
MSKLEEKLRLPGYLSIIYIRSQTVAASREECARQLIQIPVNLKDCSLEGHSTTGRPGTIEIAPARAQRIGLLSGIFLTTLPPA